MSLQTIIDKAQQIEIDRRRIVGQTISRSQRIKTSERATAQPWRFKITPPGMLKWEQSRGFIELIDLNDRVGEYEISLSNTPNLEYITEYQGDLNSTQTSALTIASVGTNTMVLTTLPTIGDTLTSRSYSATAKSFAASTSNLYNRAFSTTRTDFLITNSEYNSNYANIKVGDVLTATTYVTGGQTISSITYNYITLATVGYTRIVMSAVANDSSPAATVNGGDDIATTVSNTVLVTSSTYVFKKGDFIQPDNSRYPYSVTADVVRGVNTTTSVSLNRNIITSEAVTLAGAQLDVGVAVTWRVVVAALPSYQLVPGKNVQYTGDFELIEKVI